MEHLIDVPCTRFSAVPPVGLGHDHGGELPRSTRAIPVGFGCPIGQGRDLDRLFHGYLITAQVQCSEEGSERCAGLA